MVKQKKLKSRIWNKNIKDVPLVKIILAGVGIAILGFVLGFTIIRIVFKSIASLVLFLLLIMIIYFIIKHFDKCVE
jgi:ABC-type branched-subunit amino acid transport system permease subunit